MNRNMRSNKIETPKTINDIPDKDIVVKEENSYEKALKLVSTKSKRELAEYAKKYDIEVEQIARFLVEKKLASLKEGRLW